MYVVLPGGRFTLGRISSSLPDLDLRIIGLFVVLMLLAAGGVQKRTGVASVSAGDGTTAFAAWCIYMVATALWSPPNARIESALLDFALLFALTTLTLVAVNRIPRPSIDVVWWCLMATGIVYLIAAVVSGPNDVGRYSAFGGGPNVFVRVMILAALATLYLAVANKLYKLVWILPAFFAGAVISGSRGGVLAFAIVVLLAAIPLLRRIPRKVLWRIAVVAILGLLTLRLIISDATIQAIQYRFVHLTLEEGYSSGRDTIVAEAVRLFEMHPLLGVGVDGYFALSQYGFEYPHNLILATAAEGGVVGVLLLTLALLGFSTTVLSRPPLQTRTLFLMLGALYILVASMFSGDYYDTRFMWFFLVLAAHNARGTWEQKTPR